MQVTLQILAALIEKVPRDLPLYARSVLTVLDVILRSQDSTIVEETLPTFEIFCHHQDMATLSADQEYVVLYRDIIRAYANFASGDGVSAFKTPQSQLTLTRWKDIGLQAIKSVVGSGSLAIDGPSMLKVTVPVILENLYAGNDAFVSPLRERAKESEKIERQKERARMGRLSMQTVQSVDGTTDRDPDAAVATPADEDKAAELETRVLALRCLEKIFTAGGNRAQIHMATALVLDFILRQRKKNNGGNGIEWATDLLEVIVSWTPVQDRFVILLTITEKLIERPLVGGHLESQLTLASLIDWLLCSRLNLVGLSVVDTLIALLQHLLALHRHQRPSSSGSSQPRPPSSEKAAGNGNESAPASPVHENNEAVSKMLRQELIELMQKCLGDLATHIYYADQVSDMIRTIVSRLKPTPSHDETNGEASPISSADTSPRDAYFSFPSARESALKTIINILVVANLRESLSGTGPDPRNRVPINVWEGTQWLLRDPSRDVRNAYVEAFLSWLQLETDKNDLKLAPEPPRNSKLALPRTGGDSHEGAARRAITPVSQREKTGIATASTFLQLLHLTLYEIASDSSTMKLDIAVLHLLLSTMVENMGVNAVRYGLPVMMKLQNDYLSDEKQYTVTQMRQIGSLVHGYLWAIVEHFNLEGTKVGRAILSEISTRKDRGLWLDNIQIPPHQLNSIVPAANSDSEKNGFPEPTKDGYTAFMAINELVTQVESAYVATFASPAASPPASPGRANPITPITRTSTAWARSGLPSYVKEQMLSLWSKEACISALEAEQSSAGSIAARSRAGTAVSRNHLGPVNGVRGPSNSAANLRGDQPNISTQSFAHSVRRPSLVEAPLSPSSARKSTVGVNELRRVLSVIHPTNNTRHPPSRPGLQRTFSSGESLVTDSSGTSQLDVPAAVRLQNGHSSEQNGTDKPKVAAAEPQKGTRGNSTKRESRRVSDEIPRVPRVPSMYAVPGAFPPSTVGTLESSTNTPSRSPNRAERPRTAPSVPSGESTPTARQSRSRTRMENGDSDTRGSSPLRNVECVNGGESSGDATARANAHKAGHRNAASRPRSLGRRADVEKLLEGIVPSSGLRKTSAPLPQSPSLPLGLAARAKNAQHLTVDINSKSYRLNGLGTPRTGGTRNGIGPPPY